MYYFKSITLINRITIVTTIVYKDGILAGDSLICEGDNVSGYRDKIFDLDNVIIGVAGNSMLYNEFLKFIKGEAFDREAFKSPDLQFVGIVIEKTTRLVSRYDKELIKDICDQSEPIALGSGALIARGALLMGATPRQAIECAAKINRFTGGEIKEIKL